MMFRSLQLWMMNLSVFCRGIFQGHQRKHRERDMAILCLFVTVAYFAIWKPNIWYVVYRFLPEERGWLPTIKQETLPCQNLLVAAKLILNGEPIPLPSGQRKTLWKFKPRVSKEVILRNLVFGQNNNESVAEVLKKRKLFNVSSSEIKARKIFVTFGHNCCAYSKQRALWTAKSVGGFDYVHSFNLYSMAARFRETHNDVLKTKRGAGYWLWKPYILLKTLIENMNEGDLVMYQDAGAYFIRSAGPLLKLCVQSEHGIIVFTLNKIEHEYTKQDAMILMNMSIPEAASTFQRLASFVVLKKSCTSVQFAMEWLAYVCDRHIVSDDPNTLAVANTKEFRDHRHDQSVLSLLSKKWGLPAFRDPSQYGETVPANSYYLSGPYEQIYIHDRLKY